MVMTRPPAYHPGNFLMKNMNPTNSGLIISYVFDATKTTVDLTIINNIFKCERLDSLVFLVRDAFTHCMNLVSRSQTAIFSFILGREKIGSGTPPIEKAVLASTAIGVGDYWQWLLCNR